MSIASSIAQEIQTAEGVVVEFLAGEWTKVKQFFEGTSADAVVQQDIPAAAAVSIKVTRAELDAAHAAAAAAAEPAPAAAPVEAAKPAPAARSKPPADPPALA